MKRPDSIREPDDTPQRVHELFVQKWRDGTLYPAHCLIIQTILEQGMGSEALEEIVEFFTTGQRPKKLPEEVLVISESPQGVRDIFMNRWQNGQLNQAHIYAIARVLEEEIASPRIRKILEALTPKTQQSEGTSASDDLEKSMRQLLEENPLSLLAYFRVYKGEPWAERMVRQAAAKHPVLALTYAREYKDQPWAEGVIRQAAEKGTEAALVFADRYKDQPWAEGVIRQAAEKSAESALVFADGYKDQPWAEGVIRQAAEEEPISAIVHTRKYADQPWAKGVTRGALGKHPELIQVLSKEQYDALYGGIEAEFMGNPPSDEAIERMTEETTITGIQRKVGMAIAAILAAFAIGGISISTCEDRTKTGAGAQDAGQADTDH